MHFQYLAMNKALILSALLFISALVSAQVTARVDKKTKEFTISDEKANYSIIGYQYPNPTTNHMICFSSSESMVREESAKCQLGAYFDTERMRVGDKILYLGVVGKFARMSYVAGKAKGVIFYVLRSSFVIK